TEVLPGSFGRWRGSGGDDPEAGAPAGGGADAPGAALVPPDGFADGAGASTTAVTSGRPTDRFCELTPFWRPMVTVFSVADAESGATVSFAWPSATSSKSISPCRAGVRFAWWVLPAASVRMTTALATGFSFAPVTRS